MNASSDGGSAGPIRVLIVDDSCVLRLGLTTVLSDDPAIEIVGEAENGESAVDLARQLFPDVVLMDVNLPGMSGLEATRRLKGEFPALHIVGLSLHDDRSVADALRAAGAARYVVKGAPAEELRGAIHALRLDSPL